MPIAPKTHHVRDTTARREYDHRRGTAHERGYSQVWHRAKGPALAKIIADTANPWCRYCGIREAALIDHGLPPTRYFTPGTPEYERMFWNVRFWIPSCKRCNDIKGDMKPEELPEDMRRKLEAILRKHSTKE